MRQKLKKPIRKITEVGTQLGKVYKEAAHLGFTKRLTATWRALTLQIDLFKKKDLIMRKIRNNKMLLNVRRPGISQELAIWGEREILETRIFNSVVKKGMVVVDLGANIGYYSLMAASLVSKTGMVYAIEPLPYNFSLLVKNIEINGFYDRIESVQMAISNRNGKARFFLGKADNLGTLMDYSDLPGTLKDNIEVDTSTLDNFLSTRGNIDFLRMDIEGSECEVFEGMEKTLRQEIPPRIFFEVHPEGSIDPDPRFTPHFEQLISLGYLPRFLVSSTNPRSIPTFTNLGYRPVTQLKSGQALYENIKPEDIVTVGARRPKITRAIYLVHQKDKR